jgi:2-amino-4-hydroxy-6-hydroxymethyldihydropteridine diphosphokinase
MEVVLGIGGNRGNRLMNLKTAKRMITERLGRITENSSIVESEPWGYDSENLFLNQVIVIETDYSPEKLLDKCLGIEASMGRERSDVYTDRIIDIDILFYAGLIISSEKLTVPHPRLHERLFVLKPLAEIRPGLIHPVFNLTIRNLFSLCKDSTVTRIYQTDHSSVLLP